MHKCQVAEVSWAFVRELPPKQCLDLDRLTGVEGWTPDRKLVKLITDLKHEGRV